MASSVDTLDEILKGALIHSILPLWEVQLKLLKCLTPEGLDSHKVVHEPSADQFQESLQELFLQYEEVISSFVPISRDPRIRPFLQHCRYDLLMLLKDPKEDSVKPDPWPNVKSLLHEYGPYLESVAYIKKIVAASMRGVEELATVSVVLGVLVVSTGYCISSRSNFFTSKTHQYCPSVTYRLLNIPLMTILAHPPPPPPPCGTPYPQCEDTLL